MSVGLPWSHSLTLLLVSLSPFCCALNVVRQAAERVFHEAEAPCLPHIPASMDANPPHTFFPNLTALHTPLVPPLLLPCPNLRPHRQVRMRTRAQLSTSRSSCRRARGRRQWMWRCFWRPLATGRCARRRPRLHLSSTPCASEYILAVVEEDDGMARMVVPHDCLIPRTGETMYKAWQIVFYHTNYLLGGSIFAPKWSSKQCNQETAATHDMV